MWCQVWEKIFMRRGKNYYIISVTKGRFMIGREGMSHPIASDLANSKHKTNVSQIDPDRLLDFELLPKICL